MWSMNSVAVDAIPLILAKLVEILPQEFRRIKKYDSPVGQHVECFGALTAFNYKSID